MRGKQADNDAGKLVSKLVSAWRPYLISQTKEPNNLATPFAYTNKRNGRNVSLQFLLGKLCNLRALLLGTFAGQSVATLFKESFALLVPMNPPNRDKNKLVDTGVANCLLPPLKAYSSAAQKWEGEEAQTFTSHRVGQMTPWHQATMTSKTNLRSGLTHRPSKNPAHMGVNFSLALREE